MSRRRVQNNPTMSEVVPSTLCSGYVITSYCLTCGRCERDIAQETTWVNINRQEFGRNVLDVWDIKAICTDCSVVMNGFVRFRHDGTYDKQVRNRWVQGELVAEKTTLLKMVKEKLFSLMKR